MSHAAQAPLATDSKTVPADWQRLWYTLRARHWTTLAVVAAGDGGQADRAVKTLAAAGQRDGRAPVSMLSAVGRTPAEVKELTDHLVASTGRELSLVACAPLHDHPTMIPIVQAASAVLLVVPLGDTALASVRTAVEIIGRERILATVSVG